MNLNFFRNSYKLALALSLESSQGVLEVLARNPENANNQLNAAELFKAVDAVSAAEINNVRSVEYLSENLSQTVYFFLTNYLFKVREKAVRKQAKSGGCR